MSNIVWYFDFISPYAYLGLHTLQRLPPGTVLQYRPILFAGLLKHWGHKGPAEVPPKRQWTYRSCIWLARKDRIPFRMPAAHPFNSLPYLRLAVAAGCAPEAIQIIFRSLWTTGADPSDPLTIARLADQLSISLDRFDETSVKDELRANTQQAARNGVFGVPSFGIGAQVFWGSDAVDFAVAYLTDPGIFDDAEMRRADALPIAATRREN
jgi:2-hydroxychromene-2-carboxylate isomerase